MPPHRPRHRTVVPLALAAALAGALALPAPAAQRPDRPRTPPLEAALPTPPRTGAAPPAARPGDRPPAAPRDRRLEPRPFATRARLAAGRAADHILVRFADAVPDWQAATVAAGLGAPRWARARFAPFARVDVPAGTTPEELAARFRAQTTVEWAETDPLVHAAWEGVAAAAVRFDDPLFDLQWPLHRIRIPEALELDPDEGAGVVVAVVDTGVAYGDGATFPARRGPDLDGTAFTAGIDLVDGGPAYDGGAGDPDAPLTSPRFGHGTFVASILAATVNNAVAGASVAPRVTIMPVRVLGPDGFGTTSDVAEGITWAATHGARVINLSLGATRGSSALAEAVADAHRRGVVVVAAAGNEAEEGLFDDELGRDVAYPARYADVIAVGATTYDDGRAGYSNYGPSLDLVAPGGGDNDLVAPNVRDGVLATSFLHDPLTGGTLYGAFWATGTSFATPHVAGVAALLVGLGVDDPEAVRALLELTARDLAAPGFDDATAYGLLDAAAAHRGLGFGL